MATNENCWSNFDQGSIRQELDRILQSGPFARSWRMRRFLEYIVKESLAGRGERLKGYNVALEVFDRPATFDPVLDPIVRVEAVRLREKLDAYYATDGQSDRIRIDLAKGTYKPRIEFRQARAPAPSPCYANLTVNSNVGQRGRNRDSHLELLRGLEAFWRYTRQSCMEAQHHFTKAVTLDPDCVAARAWLARTYVFQYGMNWNGDFQTTMGPALEHARHAVELDGQSPYARSILGWVRFFMKDGEQALSAGRLACTLDSDFVDSKLFLSLFLSSTAHGEEALDNIETAILMQQHPSSMCFYALGLGQFALNNYNRAIDAFSRGIEVNPSFMACYYARALTYGVCGRVEEAKAEAAIVQADWPDVWMDFFLDPTLAAEYLRGKKVAGLA
jgi:tetratricopeptide (TPR) repeat protein